MNEVRWVVEVKHKNSPTWRPDAEFYDGWHPSAGSADPTPTDDLLKQVEKRAAALPHLDFRIVFEEKTFHSEVVYQNAGN